MGTVVMVLTLLPVVIGLVEKWVQVAEVEGLSGEEKRKLVKEAVSETLKAMEVVPGMGKIPWSVLEPVVGSCIDLVVRMYNLTGRFVKKGE